MKCGGKTGHVSLTGHVLAFEKSYHPPKEAYFGQNWVQSEVHFKGRRCIKIIPFSQLMSRLHLFNKHFSFFGC